MVAGAQNSRRVRATWKKVMNEVEVMCILSIHNVKTRLECGSGWGRNRSLFEPHSKEMCTYVGLLQQFHEAVRPLRWAAKVISRSRTDNRRKPERLQGH